MPNNPIRTSLDPAAPATVEFLVVQGISATHWQGCPICSAKPVGQGDAAIEKRVAKIGVGVEDDLLQIHEPERAAVVS